MSVTASFFSTGTAAVLLNTSGSSGDLYLPRTLSTIGRVFTIKDATGNANISSVTIRCTTGDTFESGSSNVTLNQNYGSFVLLAGADQKWYQLGGTSAVQASVSTLATSTITGDGSLLSNIILPTNLTSTVAGLGTAGYVSTAQLVSTVSSLLFTYGQVGPTDLASTVAGLGTASYISSPQLLSTVQGVYSTISTYMEVAQLTSTVAGLGTATYVSTAGLNTALTSSVAGIGTAGYISTLSATLSGASLVVSSTTAFSTLQANYISTSYINASSVTATQVLFYTATAPFSTTLTTSSSQLYINGTDIATGYYNISSMYSSLLVQGLVSTTSFLSSVSAMVDSLPQYYDNGEIASTVTGLGTAGYISSVAPTISVSTLTVNFSTIFSTVNANSVSSMSNNYSTATANYLYLISSSTAFLIETDGVDLSIGGVSYTTQYPRFDRLSSTISGSQFVSSAQLISTTAALNEYISSFIDLTELTSTVVGLGTANYSSTNSLDYTLASTTAGLGSANYISTTGLNSTLVGIRANLYGGTGIFKSTITNDLYVQSTLTVNSNFYVKSAAAFSTLAYLNNSTLLTVADIVSTVDALLNTQPTVQQLQSYNF